jgi:hypothetical protein
MMIGRQPRTLTNPGGRDHRVTGLNSARTASCGQIQIRAVIAGPKTAGAAGQQRCGEPTSAGNEETGGSPGHEHQGARGSGLPGESR